MYRPDKVFDLVPYNIYLAGTSLFTPYPHTGFLVPLFFAVPLPARTKGAVKVMIPQFIPTIWNMTDNKYDTRCP